jgi:hypothetical protein
MFRLSRRLSLSFRGTSSFSHSSSHSFPHSSAMETLGRCRDTARTRHLASTLHHVLTSSESWSGVTPSCAISVLTALADAGVRIDGVSRAAEPTILAFLPVLTVCELSLLIYASHCLDIRLPPLAVVEVVLKGCAASALPDDHADPSDIVRLLYFGRLVWLREAEADPAALSQLPFSREQSTLVATASTLVTRSAEKLFFSASLQVLELVVCATCSDEHAEGRWIHCSSAMLNERVLPVIVRHLTAMLHFDHREIPIATVALLLRMVGCNRREILSGDFFTVASRRTLCEVCFQLVHAVLPHVTLGTVVELAAAVEEVRAEFPPLLLPRSISESFDTLWALDVARRRKTGRSTVDLLTTSQVLSALSFFPRHARGLRRLLHEQDRISDLTVDEVMAVLRFINSSSFDVAEERENVTDDEPAIGPEELVDGLIDPLLAQLFVLSSVLSCDECCHLLQELNTLKAMVEPPAPLIKRLKRQFYGTFSEKDSDRNVGKQPADLAMIARTAQQLFSEASAADGAAAASLSAFRRPERSAALHPLEALRVFVVSIRRFQPVLPSDREGLISVQQLLCDWGLRSSCPDIYETLGVLGARYDPFVQ